jgi:hypothetical protein
MARDAMTGDRQRNITKPDISGPTRAGHSMSVRGHKAAPVDVATMSALPLNADIRDAKSNVRERARKLTPSLQVGSETNQATLLYLNDI